MGHGVLAGSEPWGLVLAARAPAPPKPETVCSRASPRACPVPGEPRRGRAARLSWDNTDDRAKGEDGVDLAMLIRFFAVPLGLAAVYALCTRCAVFLGCACYFFHPMAEAPTSECGEARVCVAARRRAGVYVVSCNNNHFSRSQAYADSGGWSIVLAVGLVLEVRRLLDALFQLLEGRPRHVADSDVVRGNAAPENQYCATS